MYWYYKLLFVILGVVAVGAIVIALAPRLRLPDWGSDEPPAVVEPSTDGAPPSASPGGAAPATASGPVLGGPIVVSQLPAALQRYGSLVKARMDAGKLVEARDIATTLLNQPDLAVGDPTWTWAVNAIGQINTRLLFGPDDCPEKITHKVEPGDALSRLATHYGTTVYALQKGNGIPTDSSNIRIGQILRVYRAQWRIHVSKTRSILTLYDGDRIFKAYLVGLGKQDRTPVGEFKIVDKVTEPAWKNIKYGDPGNILGTRWMRIRATGSTDPDLEGYGIHGTWDPESIGRYESNGCVRMRNDQVEELFEIVPYQTPVIIEE